MTAALAPAVLDVAAWQARRRAHEERVDVWLTPHLARRRRGERHPVNDFLFTYYSHRLVCKRYEADNKGPNR